MLFSNSKIKNSLNQLNVIGSQATQQLDLEATNIIAYAKLIPTDKQLSALIAESNPADKVKIENRNDRIDSVIEGKEYIEKKLEEDEEYKKLMRKGVTPISSPSVILTYFDYTYDSCTENKDDSKKNKKSKKK